MELGGDGLIRDPRAELPAIAPKLEQGYAAGIIAERPRLESAQPLAITNGGPPANDNEPPEDDNIPLTPGGLPDTGAPGH